MEVLKVYKSGNGYIGKLDTSKMKSNASNKDMHFIVILDVSGSMGQTVPRFINVILRFVSHLITNKYHANYSVPF